MVHPDGAICEKTGNWRKVDKQNSSTFYTSNDVFPGGVEKKKLSGCNNNDISLRSIEAQTSAKWLVNYF